MWPGAGVQVQGLGFPCLTPDTSPDSCSSALSMVHGRDLRGLMSWQVLEQQSPTFMGEPSARAGLWCRSNACLATAGSAPGSAHMLGK